MCEEEATRASVSLCCMLSATCQLGLHRVQAVRKGARSKVKARMLGDQATSPGAAPRVRAIMRVEGCGNSPHQGCGRNVRPTIPMLRCTGASHESPTVPGGLPTEYRVASAPSGHTRAAMARIGVIMTWGPGARAG